MELPFPSVRDYLFLVSDVVPQKMRTKAKALSPQDFMLSSLYCSTYTFWSIKDFSFLRLFV